MNFFLPLPDSLSKAKEIGSKYYFIGKPCAQGHLCKRYTKNRQCAECSSMRGAAWRERNPSAAKEATERWRIQNKEQILEVRRNHYKMNAEKFREEKSRIYFSNIELSREKERARYIKRKESNKLYREENKRKKEWIASQFMRNNIHRIIRDKSRKKSETLVGYTRLDLIKRIESLMLPWMSWDNYGFSWEIDHVIPVDFFIKQGITCVKIINSLDNLRPLDRTENKRKSNKLVQK